ncbi:hypothetical protein NMY22_g5201 [Coprinellus aureogranulatus]|nr:hypothetical protein NMY22_g5201 [Coprinellus aureogranulatus]
MAAVAPVEPAPQQPTSHIKYTGPGEAALQRGADEILAIIEQEKQLAIRNHEAEIAHLRGQLHAANNHVGALRNQNEAAQQQHDRERQANIEKLQQALRDPNPTDLRPTIDALLKERHLERAEFNSSLASANAAVEQMGIYTAGPGLYSFAAPWAELFNELGIAGGVPWRPDQLLAIISSTAERLRLHRGDAPPHVQHLSPNLQDPFVLETELNRARRYVSRLEERQAKSQAQHQASAVGPATTPSAPPNAP